MYIHVLLVPKHFDMRGRTQTLVDGEWCYDISDLLERAYATPPNVVPPLPNSPQWAVRARAASAGLTPISK